MQPETHTPSRNRTANAGVAGLLAALLFAFSALSVCHSLHQFLHSDGGTSHHQCLLCSLAKGQVSGVEVAVTGVALVLGVFTVARLGNPLPGRTFDYRLSPSRAPPRR